VNPYGSGLHSRLAGVVITDVDAFVEDDEEDEGGKPMVNSALLDRIRQSRLGGQKEKSQALILFKPMPSPPGITGEMEVDKDRAV